jgi:hypothetical protein
MSAIGRSDLETCRPGPRRDLSGAGERRTGGRARGGREMNDMWAIAMMMSCGLFADSIRERSASMCGYSCKTWLTGWKRRPAWFAAS